MPLLRSRRAPSTTPEQSAQIRSLEPVYAKVPLNPEPQLVARPCAITMKDGTVHERAYMVESRSRPIHHTWLDIQDVADIRESPHRLPAKVATRLYEFGEMGMGYQLYTIEFNDGSVIHCVNNAWYCDFPDLPRGYDISMIKSVHVPADKSHQDWRRDHEAPFVAFWFHDQPRHTFRRFLHSLWHFFTNP